MAIVVDKARPTVAADVSYCKENRSHTTTPIANLIPLYRGELVRALDTGQLYRGTGTDLNSSWEMISNNV